MGFHVNLNIIFPGKVLPTQSTLIGLVSCVYLQVLPQFTRLRKSSAALVTLEIIHPCVSALVNYQVISSSEALVAVCTLVWTFSSMTP